MFYAPDVDGGIYRYPGMHEKAGRVSHMNKLTSTSWYDLKDLHIMSMVVKPNTMLLALMRSIKPSP